MSALRDLVEHKRREIADRRRARPISALRDAPRPPARDFAAALRRPGLSFIAEIKRRSPSRGAIRETLDPAEIAIEYETAGAAALSVLTESSQFGGRDADLTVARAAVGLPVLRKDFTIDAYQIHEAAVIGADAVLLIARILSDGDLIDLLTLAAELRLASLVEVHDEYELDRALRFDAAIIGINNRDLDSLRVDLDTCLRLRPRVPAGVVTVAESGLHTRDDVLRIESAGFDAVLVGEALLTSPRPGQRLRELAGTLS